MKYLSIAYADKEAICDKNLFTTLEQRDFWRQAKTLAEKS